MTWSEDDFVIKSKCYHFTFVSYITWILSLQDDTVFRNMFHLLLFPFTPEFCKTNYKLFNLFKILLKIYRNLFIPWIAYIKSCFYVWLEVEELKENQIWQVLGVFLFFFVFWFFCVLVFFYFHLPVSSGWSSASLAWMQTELCSL